MALQKGVLDRKERQETLSYSVITTEYGEGDGHNLLFCGLPGTGKSSFASSFPDPLFINFDHGLNAPKIVENKVKQITMHRGMETSRMMMQILWDIQEKQGMFKDWQPKTLIIDTFTVLSNHLLEECDIYDPDTKDRRQYYMLLAQRGARIVDYALGLCPYVIFITNMELYQDDILGAKIEAPSAEGQKLQMILGHSFSEVYKFDVEGKGDAKKYLLKTEKDLRFKYAKTRRPNMPDVLQINKGKEYLGFNDVLKKYFE